MKDSGTFVTIELRWAITDCGAGKCFSAHKRMSASARICAWFSDSWKNVRCHSRYSDCRFDAWALSLSMIGFQKLSSSPCHISDPVRPLLLKSTWTNDASYHLFQMTVDHCSKDSESSGSKVQYQVVGQELYGTKDALNNSAKFSV